MIDNDVKLLAFLQNTIEVKAKCTVILQHLTIKNYNFTAVALLILGATNF